MFQETLNPVEKKMQKSINKPTMMAPMEKIHFNRSYHFQRSNYIKNSNRSGITIGGWMMKTLKFTSLAVVFFSACVLTVQAQGLQDVRFGVNVGMNVASFIGGESDAYGNRTAFHIAGLAEIPLEEKITLVPEIVYSMQGSTQTTRFGEDIYKVNYINIPVMIMYYPVENFSIGVGPQLGILMSANVEVDDSGSAYSGGLSYTLDIKEHVNDIDFSLNIGAGFHFGNGLFIQGRYNFGLSDVMVTSTNSGYSADVNNSLQNSVFQLSVGFVLGR
jgi:hypothetical protein